MADIKHWDYILLHEESNKEIDRLLALYEKNRQHARVIFLSSNYQRYSYARLCLFEDPDSDNFDIVVFRVKHGISITNKKFRHSKREATLRYREDTGFWICRNGNIRRPNDLAHDLGINHTIIKQILITKFSWYRCMFENNISFDKSLTVHTVWSKKLFNLQKLLKAYYKVPIGPARLLHKVYGRKPNNELIKEIRDKGKFLKNVENLSKDFLSNDNEIIFKDSIKMAKKLGKIVNCSWGVKRLKKEHDDWSEELTNILFVEDNKILNVSGVFHQFAEFSGYYMIKTTRGLALEGKRQKHCVGGYSASVNSGSCAIFHVNGYTLDVRSISVKGEGFGSAKVNLSNGQFRGFLNKDAPPELEEEVNEKIKDFNEEFKEHDALKNSWFTFGGDESKREYHITEGAHEYDIFDLDDIGDDGEPRRILIDETLVNVDGAPIEDIGLLIQDNVDDIALGGTYGLVQHVFNGDPDDLPF